MVIRSIVKPITHILIVLSCCYANSDDLDLSIYLSTLHDRVFGPTLLVCLMSQMRINQRHFYFHDRTFYNLITKLSLTTPEPRRSVVGHCHIQHGQHSLFIVYVHIVHYPIMSMLTWFTWIRLEESYVKCIE